MNPEENDFLLKSLSQRTLESAPRNPLFEKELERRKAQYIHRPYSMVEAERLTTDKAMKYYGIQLERQLGELAKIYGKTVSVIDNILNDVFSGKVCRGVDFTTTDESYRIQCPLRIFSKKFTTGERRQLIRNAELLSRKATFLIDEPEGGSRFIQRRPIDIAFDGELDSKKVQNLKGINKEKYINRLIVEGKTLNTQIIITVGKDTYGVLEKFLKNFTAKNKKLNYQGGVIKSPRDLPFVLDETFMRNRDMVCILLTAEHTRIKELYKAGKPNGVDEIRKSFFWQESPTKVVKTIKKYKYNDRMRVGFEKIIDVYLRGAQNREKNYIDFEDKIYNLIFFSQKAGNHIKFGLIIATYNSVLNRHNLPITLQIYKKGKAQRYCKAFLGERK